MSTCRYCGVLEQYGHTDWCKKTRAPTAKEVLEAVIEENRLSVDEGPSYDLTNMAKCALKHLEDK